MLHVAILAQFLRVELFVGAATGELGSTLLMIAIFAHALGVEVAFGVFAVGDHFFLALGGGVLAGLSTAHAALIVLIALVCLLFALPPSLLADNHGLLGL